LLVIRCNTSVRLKALKDGPDLLDPDIGVFTCHQSDAMSKLIVFVYTGEVGDAIPLVKVCPCCHGRCPKKGPQVC
jgi:hypothetical protein